jgi:predicted TIM-barrel fold metal-dependent hydrolase
MKKESREIRAPVTEAIIDPELPICDPHHHLWRMPDRRYLIDNLYQDIHCGHNIVNTIVVESESVENTGQTDELYPVEETRFINDLTNLPIGLAVGTSLTETRVAAGIIGYADLTSGVRVVKVLEAHLAASSRFRGIRQICTWDADSTNFRSIGRPGLLLDTKLREGLTQLRKLNLVFETFIYHPQLKELLVLAKTCPDNLIVLEHIGGPLGLGLYAGKRREVFNEWADGIASLAACPNVFLKLGGFGMPFNGFRWGEQSTPLTSYTIAGVIEPYILTCIEKFGIKRCMFESNFPVDKTSYSYSIIWNSFKRVCQFFSAGERAALFFDTASSVYRLQGK